ncbi:formamidopyrimidine-DNA glycosylase [Staphylococcus piscifermentans]|uniref:Formamidopyrimidine-DNA glycosylase n=1 Tax=Staphylococcus piscifermentans TaxID=70258 RepID=A0A239U0I1_9STAP|nr:bifunctional DNA-formamidopyrimidine glycosylase/DNA-(apurinic or apyrimidinic site) lyase [Staphylococcus piscifermentans]RTX83992.1 bifunctional DNA-formamidopyrimidine glycosylase/DNA-(apurinic or apyrimidinic site) lyase [Staphylococcus piscifermentans]GEP84115.1 formamidopyrimidine-DNA glycosylase [Staphylococcus piscifermentans]SNV03352.1 formamidopyrimidine-DNA glycosylase [Staphylococcus piscifermentans]
MPELPEVEHVKRGIEPLAINQYIEEVEFSDAVIKGKEIGKDTIIKQMDLPMFKLYSEGYKITRIERRSKYILFYIETDKDKRVLVSHLGMSGGFFIVDTLDDIIVPNYKKHWHVNFKLSNGKQLIFSDIRRFGEIKNVADLSVHSSFSDMAPEPFDETAFAHYKLQLSTKTYRKKPIKQVILDHKVIAGCGNIYACEALFNAKIDPERPVYSLTEVEQKRVFDEVVKVLRLGIENGGTSVSSYRHADGKTGQMQHYLKVYKKKVCPVCGGPIHTKVIAGRNSHYCPQCQK